MHVKIANVIPKQSNHYCPICLPGTNPTGTNARKLFQCLLMLGVIGVYPAQLPQLLPTIMNARALCCVVHAVLQ